jgi:hypothetical protein
MIDGRVVARRGSRGFDRDAANGIVLHRVGVCQNRHAKTNPEPVKFQQNQGSNQ